MRALLAALAVLLAAGAARAQVLTPGNHDRTIVVDGLTRTYMVHVPPSYDGVTPVPMVVDFHGLSGSSFQQAGLSGFRTLSDVEGFITVHPQGVGNAWNGGVCCASTPDDVAFTRALVAKMHDEAEIDARRVYATGLSNGGAMTQRLACEAADLFAAAAPVAFPISISPSANCVPSRRIPVLTFMGLTDVLVLYEGGAFPSAATTFAHWRASNACGTEPPEIHTAVGLSYCDIDTSCADGARVGLCSLTAMAFPGQYFSGHILYLNPDYDVAVTAWDFMNDFALPQSPQIPAMSFAWGGILCALLGFVAARKSG